MSSNPIETPSGRLLIVATPIGNMDDITLRAIQTLKEVDAVICEEYREGSTLLKRLEIENKTIYELNEHNEAKEAVVILQHILAGKNLALISDCGTPVFADPGHHLIRLAVEAGVNVIPIPGVSSLMTALSLLDFRIKRFAFGGFLPREADDRRLELEKLRATKMPVVLMDTPYRLLRLLDEVQHTFGVDRRITLACNLTRPDEKIYRGALSSVKEQLEQNKAEFILIIHESENVKRGRNRKARGTN